MSDADPLTLLDLHPSTGSFLEEVLAGHDQGTPEGLGGALLLDLLLQDGVRGATRHRVRVHLRALGTPERVDIRGGGLTLHPESGAPRACGDRVVLTHADGVLQGDPAGAGMAWCRPSPRSQGPVPS